MMARSLRLPTPVVSLGNCSGKTPSELSVPGPIVGFYRRGRVGADNAMKHRKQDKSMKNQVRAIVLGAAFSLASAGVGHAMSELISMSKEPVWPASPTPDGTLVYNVTTVGRAGAGLLEVTLSAGAMPPGVTVTFFPSVLRFTGNQLKSQTATMTVTCTGLIPIDCFPFTLTGTALREATTVTNEVVYSAEFLATRVPTLIADKLADGSLRLRGSGATGKTYKIESSPSVSHPAWTLEGSSIADANGRFTFFTAKTSNSSMRFFRAVTSPGPAGQ
jgi:hypothetical protein